MVKVFEIKGDDANPEYVRLGDNMPAGYSVSLSSDGKTVAIGAPGNDNGNGDDSGHVKVYKYTEVDGWTQLGPEILGAAEGDESGRSVSLSSDGKIVAIGAPYNDNSKGHVRVFKYKEDDNGNKVWTQMGGDIVGSAAVDFLGYSVSLSSDGKIVAIGAPLNDNGHVRVFEYKEDDNGNKVWTQLGGDINGAAKYDQSGYSVSLSSDGKIVAIGAIYNNNGNGKDSGHVRVYEYTEVDGWTQLGDEIIGEAAGDESGYSVSLSSIEIDDTYYTFVAITSHSGYSVYYYSEEVGWYSIKSENIDNARSISLSGNTNTEGSNIKLNLTIGFPKANKFEVIKLGYKPIAPYDITYVKNIDLYAVTFINANFISFYKYIDYDTTTTPFKFVKSYGEYGNGDKNSQKDDDFFNNPKNIIYNNDSEEIALIDNANSRIKFIKAERVDDENVTVTKNGVYYMPFESTSVNKIYSITYYKKEKMYVFMYYNSFSLYYKENNQLINITFSDDDDTNRFINIKYINTNKFILLTENSIIKLSLNKNNNVYEFQKDITTSIDYKPSFVEITRMGKFKITTSSGNGTQNSYSYMYDKNLKNIKSDRIINGSNGIQRISNRGYVICDTNNNKLGIDYGIKPSTLTYDNMMGEYSLLTDYNSRDDMYYDVKYDVTNNTYVVSDILNYNIYVFDVNYNNNKLIIFKPKIIYQEFTYPTRIAIHTIGNDTYYVICDSGNNRIKVIKPTYDTTDGVTFELIGNYGEHGSGDGEFTDPRGIAIHTIDDDTYYVICDSGNNRIKVIKPTYDTNNGVTFELIGNYGEHGSGDGKFMDPRGIAIHTIGDDTYYVICDTYNNRIKVIKPTYDTNNGVTFELISNYGEYGSDDNKFKYPEGIAIHTIGNDTYYVICDTYNNRIKVIKPTYDTNNGVTFELIGNYGEHGSGDGEFMDPQGIAIHTIDDDTYYVICDTYNNRIVRVKASDIIQPSVPLTVQSVPSFVVGNNEPQLPIQVSGTGLNTVTSIQYLKDDFTILQTFSNFNVSQDGTTLTINEWYKPTPYYDYKLRFLDSNDQTLIDDFPVTNPSTGPDPSNIDPPGSFTVGKTINQGDVLQLDSQNGLSAQFDTVKNVIYESNGEKISIIWTFNQNDKNLIINFNQNVTVSDTDVIILTWINTSNESTDIILNPIIPPDAEITGINNFYPDVTIFNIIEITGNNLVNYDNSFYKRSSNNIGIIYYDINNTYFKLSGITEADPIPPSTDPPDLPTIVEPGDKIGITVSNTSYTFIATKASYEIDVNDLIIRSNDIDLISRLVYNDSINLNQIVYGDGNNSLPDPFVENVETNEYIIRIVNFILDNSLTPTTGDSIILTYNLPENTFLGLETPSTTGNINDLELFVTTVL